MTNRRINLEGGDFREINNSGTYVEGDFSIHSSQNVSRSSNEERLLNQVATEIHQTLKQSLHQSAYINLSKELVPEFVHRDWAYEDKTFSTSSGSLDVSTEEIWLFRLEYA